MLKKGPTLTVWPSWPGNPNTDHANGGTITDLGMAWGAGHPALIVNHEAGAFASGTWFEDFSFTPASAS